MKFSRCVYVKGRLLKNYTLCLQNKSNSEQPVTGSDPGISSNSASDMEDVDNEVSNRVQRKVETREWVPSNH